MSDNESYSGNNSEVDSDSEDSTNENEIHKIKILKTPVVGGNIALKHINIDDDDDDDEDDEVVHSESDEEEEEDEQIGGANEDPDTQDDDVEDDDIELDEDGEPIIKQVKNKQKKTEAVSIQIDSGDEDDDEQNGGNNEDDDLDENYLQKFDGEITKRYIQDFHPECLSHNYDEIAILTHVVRDENNIIIDPLHKTIPYLTKYEKARILGQRAKQIECGAKPLVKVSEHIIDSYVIAELELQQKRIPFIIRRPLSNGSCEYWSLKDLEMITF